MTTADPQQGSTSDTRSYAALRYPASRIYLLGAALAMMADSIEHVISYWIIFEKFQSPSLAGFAVIAHWVPFLLCSIWAGALADRRIAILANHGVITTGPTVAHAFNDLYYLERAAQAQVLAYSTGRPVQRIPQSVCETTFQQMQADRDDQATRFLAEIKRLLDKEEPDYAD